MSTQKILRVYDPDECDERGFALDWEKCRTCKGTGRGHTHGAAPPVGSCPVCGGHGSLKAAALAALRRRAYLLGRYGPAPVTPPPSTVPVPDSFVTRCEDCGHPKSEGTYEGDHPRPDLVLAAAASELMTGAEEPSYYGTWFYRCDGLCRHGGPGRAIYQRDGDTQTIDIGEQGSTPKDWLILNSEPLVEASWRPVEVRTLGWPMDLRPERLAVLCLRCYADREASRGD